MAEAKIRRDLQKDFVKFFSLLKADGEARIIRASACNEAEVFKKLISTLESIVRETLEKLEKEAQKIFEESREKGRNEITIKFKKIIANFIKEKDKVFKEIGRKISERVISICEVVIDEELKTDRTLIVRLVEKELRRISGQNFVLYLSPADFGELKGLAESMKEFNGFKIVSNEKLKEGDCLLESEAGMVDISLRNRLQKMINLLKDENYE